VPFQTRIVAPVGDGMEVKRERLGLRKEKIGQGPNPTGQKGALVVPTRAVGIGRGVGLLGQNVQTGEQAEGDIEVKVIDVTAALLVEQLQCQQAQQGGGCRDHG